MITHHDGCFGCGQANLFGLQLETDGVRGRFFVKQDHQGPPGYAHGGIVATALDEAMALALHAQGLDTRTRRLELDLLAPAPVGAFLEVEASVETREGGRIRTRASAREGDTLVAEAVAVFVVS
ncbi:MAG TPA: PaaI family thioesterase [Thermoleophilaceae bacterium]